MTNEEPELQSLDSKPAPPGMGEAIRGAAALPARAVAALSELLPELMETLPDDQLDNRIVRLCGRIQLDAAGMAPPLKATRALLRSAAALAVDEAGLRVDLDVLGVTGELGDGIAAIYRQVLPALREEVIVGALQAHGRVLAGIEWRIDTIGSSSRGRQINTPVALVTLHYQDRRDAGSFTIQMLPHMVKELRDACDELLS